MLVVVGLQSSRSLPHFLGTPALAGGACHFLASLASALCIRIRRRRCVATAQADEILLRPAEHRPEFVAQHTIRATHNLLRHRSPSLSLTLTSVRFWPWPSRGGLAGQARGPLRGWFALAFFYTVNRYLRGITLRKEWPIRLANIA